MTAVAFTVYGIPAPQGSKTRTRWGVREDNPRTMPWRQDVAGVAARAMAGRPLLEGPLAASAQFVFPHPKSHYGTGRNANTLKPSAARYCTSKPDADKLARAVGDALTGVVFRDDSQIVRWEIVKVYGREPSAQLHISEVTA